MKKGDGTPGTGHRQQGHHGSRSPEPGARCPGWEGGSLYVVATPIGNLADISRRAVEVLGRVHQVLAEDTRRVRGLLSHFGVSVAVRSLHEHNEEREVARLLAVLAEGHDLALVSDAGTPLLADPGYRVVRACRERGVPVLAIPGASAVTAALAVSGVPPVPFTFGGFLPPRERGRTTALGRLAELPHTLVLFLSPHRLPAEVSACAAELGATREACLLAELTKVHERCMRGTLAEVARRVSRMEPRGEYTLVVGPPPPREPTPPSARAAQLAVDAARARGLDRAHALREAARELGVSRRALYAMLMPRGR
jgi:16S rRNA (cytidine1402-2'-O)-methyltransferase